jgi:pilus assembly protein CpaB
MGRRTLLLIASILVAALGTALIWLYVQGADSRAQAGEVQVQVYVATRSLSAGDPVDGSIATRKSFPQSVADAFGAQRVRSPAEITGFAKTDIVPGMPLLTSQFTSQQSSPTPAVALAKNEVAMQLTLPDPQRLAGLLQPGSRIRVYAPMTEGSKKGVGVLFQNVRVLTSGPVTNTATGAKTNVPQAIVTLALNKDQARALAFAETSAGGAGGSMWFALLPSSDAPNDDSPDLTSNVSPGGL